MKIIVLALMFPFSLLGQQSDSIKSSNAFHYENKVQNRLWGNSWHASISATLNNTLQGRRTFLSSASQEFNINVGRTFGSTFGGHVGFSIKTRSYGLGYGIALSDNKIKQIINSYWEFSFVHVPLLPLGIRADYFFNFSDLRPSIRTSVGASFVYVDIFYSYTFSLKKSENSNGVTFRVKYFYKPKNWQRGFPD